MTTLILFDIDGTLVTGGPAKEAFEVAMLDTFGRLGNAQDYDFSGKTDPRIARDLLKEVGFSDVVIEEGLSRLWDRYVIELEARITGSPTVLLPGVEQLLLNLERNQSVALGLVTGNIYRGAQIKLKSARLAEYFSVGGYGSDSENRNLLPAVALDRAREKWGVDFQKESVLVIGDTPRDVLCGKAEGTRTVGVATGRFTKQDLMEVGADMVFDDFSQVEKVADLLTR